MPPASLATRRWYDDAAFLRQLPWPYHLYAAYHRRSADPASGWLARGHAIHRALRALSRRFDWQPEAVVEAGGLALCLDLLDYQARTAFDELRRQDASVRLLTSLLAPGDTVVDVGANYGTFSLIAAECVGPEGRVYSVEPQPRHAALLRRSAALNGFSDRLRVIEAACAERSGDVTVYVPDESSGKTSLYDAYAGRAAHRTLTVRAAPLDDLLDGAPMPGAVVVKIDVEGAERVVLQGAGALLSRRPLLLFELHPRSSRAAGYAPAALLRQLDGLGYTRFMVVGAATPEWLPPDAVPTDRRRDVVALPTGAEIWAGRLPSIPFL